MKLTKVKSSQIQAIGWQENFIYNKNKRPRNTLRIQFMNDSVYDYLGVSKATFENFLRATSKGTYFRKKIKFHYTTIKRDKNEI